MSDAYGTVRGYPSFVMLASPAKPFKGALGTGGDALVQRQTDADADRKDAHRKEERRLAARRLLALQGASLEPPPPYQETPLSIVREAARSARRSAIPAQIAGGIVTIVVSIVLYIVSANGVVITLTATISGVLAGSLVATSLGVHRRSRSQRALQVGSPPRPLPPGTRAKADRRNASRKRP